VVLQDRKRSHLGYTSNVISHPQPYTAVPAEASGTGLALFTKSFASFRHGTCCTIGPMVILCLVSDTAHNFKLQSQAALLRDTTSNSQGVVMADKSIRWYGALTLYGSTTLYCKRSIPGRFFLLPQPQPKPIVTGCSTIQPTG